MNVAKSFACLSAMTACLIAPAISQAQGHMEIVNLETIKWMPCNPNAPQPDVCQLAYFKGDPAKEPNYKMLKAKAGFVFPPHWHNNSEYLVVTKGTIKIAAEDGQEQDTTLARRRFIVSPRQHAAEVLRAPLYPFREPPGGR
jgi:hypothetical protein